MASGMSDDDKVAILLVDDQPSQLLSHQAILRELGERLVTARSGREALQRLMDEDFAVILLDVNMPDMDGFETASLIHQHPRFEKTPIVFVTGAQPTTLDRLKGYRVGAVDYVEVPVVPEILRSKVAVFVDLNRKRRDLQRLNDALQAEIAQRRNAEEAVRHSREKEVLLQEIHHRVKNNLQIITSLLRMQSRAVQDPAFSEALRECQNRVASRRGSSVIWKPSLRRSASSRNVRSTVALRAANDTLSTSIVTVPDSILERSRMSLMRFMRSTPAAWIMLANSTCLSVRFRGAFSASCWPRMRMLFSGVRSSCDMLARNSDLYRDVIASSDALSSSARRACSISAFLRSTSAFCSTSSAAFLSSH